MNKHLKPDSQSFWQWLTSELSERMAQNLPFIKMEPSKILLIGEHSQATETFFLNTYSQAILLTESVKKQTFIQSLNPFQNKRIQNINPQTISNMNNLDLLWAGPLALDIDRYPSFFEKYVQLLKQQGLMMFNYLGPDTAREWHPLLKKRGWIGPDMHDIGDSLIKAGFADPVMNMEYIHLEYESIDLLIGDLRSMQLLDFDDESNQRTKAEFKKQVDRNGKAQLTLEVVYGHAWKVLKKTPGISTISVESIGRTYKK
jgi:malonyl-CoA O-methyltransferase